MSSSNFFVTPSTSLYLIRNVSAPTFVYLSSFKTPDFDVTIRDTTGLLSIQTNSVRISTIGSARFLDGTNLYVLDKPFGLVNLSFRNSSIWQVLHTSGQAPATAAANVYTLGVSTTTFSFVSSVAKLASSLTIGNLDTTFGITINSPFVIGNLSAPGLVVVQSTFRVYGDVLLRKEFFVSGPALFQSSLTAQQLLPLSNVTHVLSSVGVGTTLSVGGPVSILSTLHTYSTNLIQSLQVQLSTPFTTLLATSLQVQGEVSSFSSVVTTNRFVTLGTLEVEETISSFAQIASTQSLNVRGDVFTSLSLSTLGNAAFLSSFSIGSTFQIFGTASISTSTDILGSLYTSSLSSVSLSTLGSLSTSLLRLTSTAFVSSGISTALLNGYGWISIGSYFYTPAVVSSLQTTQVGGDIQILGNTTLGSAFLSNSAGVGDHLDVRGNASLGSAAFQGVLSTGKSFTTLGYTEVAGNVGVGDNAFVNSNVIIQDFSEISSFFVNSFLLSNLHILTSSPALDFSASTFTASTLQTQFTTIASGNSLVRFSTFASSVRSVYATAENVRVTDMIASNFFWGSKQTTLADTSRPQFVFNAEASFTEGLSTFHFQGAIVNAATIEATFLGNGANISNVAVPYSHVSGFTTFASTISSVSFFTSSSKVSTFFNSYLTNAYSSFQSPTFAIEGLGYPLRSDINQILVVDSNNVAVNRKLFLNPLQQGVGFNNSSVSGGFDISGIFATSNLLYRQFQELYISTQGTAFFSSIYVSSSFVRDSLRFATNGIQIYASNNVVKPLVIQQTDAPFSTDLGRFGIFGYQSSIGLNSHVHIFNNTNRVMINAMSSGTLLQPEYELDVRYTIACDTGYFSSVNVNNVVYAESLRSKSLFINEPSLFSTNSISSSVQTLYLNRNLLTLKNTKNPMIGINTFTPGTRLHVNGDAFFSSVTFSGIAQASLLRLGSQLL